MKFTLKDETLPHQVVFMIHGSTLIMSCNCLMTTKRVGRIAKIEGHALVELAELYNDPGNHNAAVPFTDKDLAKW